MKKISTLFLVIICLFAALALASCGEHVHAYGEGETIIEPTCMYEGKIVYTCECGKTKSQTVEKLSHEFATALSYDNAYHFYPCVADMCTEVRNQEAHEWELQKITEPTCTEAGVKRYSCVCGATMTESIAKIGHSYGEGVVTQAPTCMEKGVMTYSCACGDAITEPIDYDTHTFGEEWVSDENSHYHECKFGCGEKRDKTEHVWKCETTAEPTCTELGEKLYTCIYCETTYTEEIEKLPHTESEEYFYNGTYHYKYCINDGDNQPVEETKVEHTWVEDKSQYVSPTEDKDGKRVYKCFCGAVKEEILSFVLHKYDSEWTIDGDYHYKGCTELNHTDYKDYGAHNWVKGNDPVEIFDGYASFVYTCGTCGHTRIGFDEY